MQLVKHFIAKPFTILYNTELVQDPNNKKCAL